MADQSARIDFTTSLTRKAWHMLRSFGNETYENFDPTDMDLETEEGEVYEAFCTEYIYYGRHQQHRALLDQFPSFDGVTVTEIGFVALHLAEVDDFDDPTAQQQIVFRLESHRLGAAIFNGGYVECGEVTELDDLLQIDAFLNGLECVMWQNQLSNGFSSVNCLPFSDTMRRIGIFLSQEADKEE